MLAALLGWGQGALASKVPIGEGSVEVTREVDGGLQTVELKLPAIVTTDLRLAEPLAALIVAMAGDYQAIVAASSAYSKNVLPHVAALLDVMQV
jgi:electron transfer flavoprotein beta subunit